METFTQDKSSTEVTMVSATKSLDSINERPTHLSLPKLTIHPYKGPPPLEIPPSQAELFIDAMTAFRQEPATLIPLPVFPAPSTRKYRSLRHRPNGQNAVVDPYLVDLPTPATIQFTKNEAIELAQWKAIAGSLREAHSEALDKLLDNPTDTKLRNQVRKLRLERERNVKAVDQVFENRHIRKNFRKDFNNMMPGW
ncbi:hypothetical protein F4859DRAFT_510867 [Xylaria cf. heliscus]|nr:hypothetical protein F4859DRAFT_510867 [Xylaria cf. heliscus]